MRKLLFNLLFLIAISLVLYIMKIVSGTIILFILGPIIALFIVLTLLQTMKEYKKLAKK